LWKKRGVRCTIRRHGDRPVWLFSAVIVGKIVMRPLSDAWLSYCERRLTERWSHETIRTESGTDSNQNAPTSTTNAPTPEEVREQVKRIVSSAVIKKEKVRRFLTFVVEETLAGRAKEINQYRVGEELFPTDSKPKDPENVVRVLAFELRKNLALYYSKAGRNDPIRVKVVSGSYVPLFGFVSAAG
jgi:hypothetical protein